MRVKLTDGIPSCQGLIQGTAISSVQIPSPDWQIPFTHTFGVGQSPSTPHWMLLQPDVLACTGAPVSAAVSHASKAAQVAPSSQGTASHAPATPQRKPGPHVVPVHGGEHVEPTPSELHPSATAWHTAPVPQSLSDAQSSRGGTPQTLRASGPRQYRPSAHAS